MGRPFMVKAYQSYSWLNFCYQSVNFMHIIRLILAGKVLQFSLKLRNPRLSAVESYDIHIYFELLFLKHYNVV